MNSKRNKENINIIELEIYNIKKKRRRLLINIPLVVFILIILSLIIPYLSNTRGNEPLIRSMKYEYAVILVITIALVYYMYYLISSLIKLKRKNRILLDRKKNIIESGNGIN